MIHVIVFTFDSFVEVLHPVNHLRCSDFGFNLKSYFVPSHLSNHQLHGAEKSKPSICWPAAASVCFHSAPKRKDIPRSRCGLFLRSRRRSRYCADLVDSSTSAYSGVTDHIPRTLLTDHSTAVSRQTILCQGVSGNYSSPNSLLEGILSWIFFKLFLMDVSF